MNGRIPNIALACLFAASAALLAGCSSGGDGEGIFGGLDNAVPQPPAPETRTFWATDLTTGTDYQLQADKVGEGTRCYVYLEQGRTVPQSAIDNLITEFDTRIYPGDTGAFGSEPNPGIDGDAKIFILLLDIRDGYSGGSYVAGYFDPVNEYLQSALPAGFHSNQNEMFYMDIDPGDAAGSQFTRTLAHEFQHMIHFNQENVNKGGIIDDLWLNEAMAEIAPVYCSYGPDYVGIYTFEGEPWNSLTIWGDRVEDYAVAYMWAQYLKDRIDPSSGNTIFWRMLHRPDTGIDSVNAALTDIGYGKDFGGVFRDWAVANHSGNALSWAGHPEWSYTTINTWPGIHSIGGGYAVQLPGLFGDPLKTNVGALRSLDAWSVDYYLYNPVSGNTGSVTWTAANLSSDWASLGDNTTLSFNLTSGSPYSYAGGGYLIAANPSEDNNAAGDGVAYASLHPRPATVAEMLAQAGRNGTVQRLVAMTGRPFPVCVHPFLREKMRPVSERGIRPSR